MCRDTKKGSLGPGYGDMKGVKVHKVGWFGMNMGHPRSWIRPMHRRNFVCDGGDVTTTFSTCNLKFFKHCFFAEKDSKSSSTLLQFTGAVKRCISIPSGHALSVVTQLSCSRECIKVGPQRNANESAGCKTSRVVPHSPRRIPLY